MFYIFSEIYKSLTLGLHSCLRLGRKLETEYMFYIFSKIYKSLTLGLHSCLRLGRKLETEYMFYIFFPKYINLSHLDFTAVSDLDVSWKQNTCFIFFF